MNGNEFQLADTALQVLPGYDPQEFEQWFHSSYLLAENLATDNTDAAIPDYAIVEYHFNRKQIINLPASYQRFTEIVTAHLETTEQDDPWGMLDNDLIVLKLSDRPNSPSRCVLLFRARRSGRRSCYLCSSSWGDQF